MKAVVCTEFGPPENLVVQAWQWARTEELNEQRLRGMRDGSALGRILAAGLANRDRDREIMKESIEDVGRHVVHELERYLNALGTIASITPLRNLGFMDWVSSNILYVKAAQHTN